MSNPIITRSLAAAAVITISILGLYSWHLTQELAAAQSDSASAASPALMEKLGNLAQQQQQSFASDFPALIDPGAFFGGTGPAQQLQQHMDALFRSLSAPAASFGFSSPLLGDLHQPQINVLESEEEYRVTIPIAEGIDIDLATDLADRTLSISAEVRSQISNSSGSRHTSQSSISQFSRSIVLDEAVDATGMRTEKRADEIVITIPKLG